MKTKPTRYIMASDAADILHSARMGGQTANCIRVYPDGTAKMEWKPGNLYRIREDEYFFSPGIILDLAREELGWSGPSEEWFEGGQDAADIATADILSACTPAAWDRIIRGAIENA